MPARLAQHRRLAAESVAFLKLAAATRIPRRPCGRLRPVAGIYDPQAEETTNEAHFATALRLDREHVHAGGEAIHRLRAGKEPLEPRLETSVIPGTSWAYLLNGRVPTADDAGQGADLILILHAEHGFNASTFADARVTAPPCRTGTRSSPGRSSALKGPLHGGANIEVLKTLMEIGDVKNVPAYVESVRNRKGNSWALAMRSIRSCEDRAARHLKELRAAGSRTGRDPLVRHLAGAGAGCQRGDPARTATSIYIRRACSITWGSRPSCLPASSPPAASPAESAHVLEQWDDNKIIRSFQQLHWPGRAAVRERLDKR